MLKDHEVRKDHEEMIMLDLPELLELMDRLASIDFLDDKDR